ncbi:MAG TPA: signal peptidase I [Gemmatimonadota bacterium]|nr:signal peptidase I [Gemmatimonadota bacterium]
MKPGGGEGGPSLGRWVWEWTKTIATALLIFLFVRSFVVEAFQIPTGSMENTLLVGDFLLVNKAVYGAELPGIDWHLPSLEDPHRGDVVVFQPPPAAGQSPTTRYVKRVVGVPGDTLSMHDGVLYRGGGPVDEPYVKHTRPFRDLANPRFDWQSHFLVRQARAEGRYRPTRDNWGPIVVPAHRYFVMGDNRDNSEDSRYWGFVPRDAITGKPLIVYYSYRRRSAAAVPWITEIRWGRFLTPIH